MTAITATTTSDHAAYTTHAGTRARTLLTYGQSAALTSPHHSDQASLYAAKRWITSPVLTIRTLPA